MNPFQLKEIFSGTNFELSIGKYYNEDLLLDSYEEIKDQLIIKPPIFLYGKQLKQNRDVGFFSDTSIGYKYSNQIMKSQKLTDDLKNILDDVNEILGSSYNGILINRYSPNDYISAHSDDEKELDPTGVLSISFWIDNFDTTRTFRIRSKNDNLQIKFENKDTVETFNSKEVVCDIESSHLQIILMGGSDFQTKLLHEVPIRKKCDGVRISYTFRKHTN